MNTERDSPWTLKARPESLTIVTVTVTASRLQSGDLTSEHLLHAKSTLNYNHLPARKAIEKERVAQYLTRAHKNFWICVKFTP